MERRTVTVVSEVLTHHLVLEVIRAWNAEDILHPVIRALIVEVAGLIVRCRLEG
jgi:hypothetical protein